IKILFWNGVAASVVYGLFTSLKELGMMTYDGIIVFFTFIFVIIIIAIESILSRIYCEHMIDLFKLQETLFSIDIKMYIYIYYKINNIISPNKWYGFTCFRFLF